MSAGQAASGWLEGAARVSLRPAATPGSQQVPWTTMRPQAV